jgi:chromosome segregation ATPase
VSDWDGTVDGNKKAMAEFAQRQAQAQLNELEALRARLTATEAERDGARDAKKAAQAECADLRARLAAAERERDEAKAEAERQTYLWESIRDARVDAAESSLSALRERVRALLDEAAEIVEEPSIWVEDKQTRDERLSRAKRIRALRTLLDSGGEGEAASQSPGRES